MSDLLGGATIGAPRLSSSAVGVQRHIVRSGVFLLAAAWCLTPWASAPAALGVGIVLAVALHNPLARAFRAISRPLLQVCVVLLGFGMNLPDMLRAGESGLVFAVITISITLLLGWYLGKWLKIPHHTSSLISAGTAICGGSAIAAVASVLAASQGEISVAMGTVFILNAVALYVFPPIGHALGMSQVQFGAWAGVAIHDISSVVGAASHYGKNALEVATAVKLSRTLWIVPVSLAMGALARRSSSSHGKRGVGIPLFIILFVLASIARSFVPGIAVHLAPLAGDVARRGFTLTLFFIGSGLSLVTLRSVGWRPVLQGTILWLTISIGSLLAILHLGAI